MKLTLTRPGGIAACCSAIALLLSVVSAPAYSFVYHFDLGGDPVFSGAVPSGPPPWIDATFEDVAPDTVKLTVAAVGLSSAEKLTEFYINLDPVLSPTNLSFSHVSSIGTFSLPGIQTGVNAFKADGDGKYDALFSFGQPPTDAFTGGDSVSYLITGISGLTAANFVFYSAPAGGHGPFLAAAHVQGIDASSTSDPTVTSGWLAPTEVSQIPEPGSLALFSLAGIGLWFARRRAGRTA